MGSGRGHFVAAEQGRAVDLGVIRMTLKAARQETGGSFTLAEFAGTEGPWTVPHLHRQMTESFYILEGAFSFRCGQDQFDAGPGSYVLVPPGTVHVMEARAGGGRFLTLMVPGGLEDMFIELGELPSDSLRNPESEDSSRRSTTRYPRSCPSGRRRLSVDIYRRELPRI